MRVWFGLVALGVLGCSKSSGAVDPIPLSGTRVVPGMRPPAAGATKPVDDPFAEDTGGPGPPGAPANYTVTETIDSSVVRADPDDAVVRAARVSGSSCFAGLQEGPDVRSAVIAVTVIPSGSVSRAEVLGESDPGVVDCLRRVGNDLHFSSQEDVRKDNAAGTIRSFSIDIRVSRAH
jgi:hypothetical protein